MKINSTRYFIKKATPYVVIISIILILCYCLTLLTMNITVIKYDNGMGVFYYIYPSSNIAVIIVLLAILCFVTPLMNCYYSKDKNAIDVYSALPIKKEKLVNIHLLVGYYEIFVPFTLAYFIGLFILLFRGAPFDMLSYIPFYFIMIGASIMFYITNCFFVSRANTMLDAVMFELLYLIIGSIIYLSFSNFLNGFGIDITITSTFPLFLSPIDTFIVSGNYFNSSLLGKLGKAGAGVFENYKVEYILTYVVNFIYAGLSYFGIMYGCKHDKNENAEQRSNSWFGYKTMLPILLALSLMLISVVYSTGNIMSTLLEYVLILSAYVIANMALEYRSIRIPKSRYIVMVCILATFIILNSVANFVN